MAMSKALPARPIESPDSVVSPDGFQTADALLAAATGDGRQ